MSTSAKPSGLSISRKGDKYIFSWKKGGTYGDGQQLQYSYATAANQGSTIKIVQSKVIKLGASKTKRAVTIKSDIQYDPDNPNAKKFVQQVSFAVRGKADGKKWSAWVPYALNMGAPVGLQVKADWDTTTPNKTTFTYSVKDDDEFPFDHIEFQTVRVSDCPENFKAEEFWKDAEVRTMTGKSGTLFDDPEAGLSGSMTRLVRVKAVGVAGETGWYYQYHVYAQPYAASVISAKADFNSLTGFFDAAMEWTIQHNKTQHPVDKQIVRYCIGTPTAGLGLPGSPDWQDADTPVITSPDQYTIEELYTEDTSGIAAAQSLRGYMVESTGNEPERYRGQIGRALANDECLWVRIKTQHDNNNNFSVPANLVSKGPLAKPTLTISANKNTHTIAVTSTNASSVPDAQVAFVYQDPVTNESAVLGIRTGNTTNMIVPAWTDEPGMVGAYAFVGSYIAQPARTDGTIVYSVLADWQSDTEWAQSPQAPTLSVRKYDDTTAALTWNWPYKEAMSAEVSWSDHEDAWESTDRPNTYDIQNYQAAKWNISNLESGKVWYFRVRLYYGDGESAIYGSYSNTASLDLTVPPVKPVLTLSDQIITGTGSVTANWYSPDNQEYAVIAELIDGEPRLLKQVGAEKGVTLYAAAPELEWETGTKHDLVVMYSANNRQSEWSDPVTLTIAEPLSCTISETSLENTTISIDPQVESGSLITLNGGDDTNVRDVTSLQVSLEPVQDNKYDSVWSGGNGKNKLPNTTGTITTGGVTFTEQTDGAVLINGTATANLSYDYYRNLTKLPTGIKAGSTYVISNNVVPTPCKIEVFYSTDGLSLTALTSMSSVTSVNFTLPTEAVGLLVRIWVSSGDTISNLLFRTMVRESTESSDWQPYSNIVPITGHDSVGANVRGHNQWDEEWEVGGLNGSTGALWNTTDRIRSKNFIDVKPSASYYIHYPTSGVAMEYCFYDADKTFISSGTNVNSVITTPTNARYMKFATYAQYGTTYNNDISINYPSTDHDYHAYTGSTYTAALGQTVYGGNAELVGGTGKSTWGIYQFTGDESITRNMQGNNYRFLISGISGAVATNAEGTNIKCSHYIGNRSPLYDNVINGAIGIAGQYMSWRDDSITNVNDMKTYLQAQANAGTPVTVVYELATPTDLTFTPQSITLNEGNNNVWSENGDVTIRTVEGYEDVLALRQLPLDITVLGAGTAGNTMLAITRAEDFFLERPDEKETGGFKGDTVVQVNQSGESEITIERDDLIDTFDDGAKYLITASVQDGFGQSATATLEFMVVWEHQALPAEGTARVEDGVGKIRAIKPSTALDTDTVDIYRLSADAPELIYKGAPFNQTIIDPYPTIGEFGGYRIVLVTADGDYITQDNEPDWLDIQAGLETLFQYINFAGRELELRYNVDLDSAWAKKFNVTNYLGGGIEGFWEEGINRNDSVKGIVPLDLDPDTYELVHRLGRYLGKCQVRTKAGSNFTANIDVSENSTFNSPAHPHSVSFGITKIDNTSLDGMTEEDWQNGL